MSGRSNEGPRSGRSQNSQGRNAAGYGVGRGSGSRLRNNPAGFGRGNAPLGNTHSENQVSGQMEGGLVLPYGGSAQPHPNIMFGTFGTHEDGSVESAPSPQRTERGTKLEQKKAQPNANMQPPMFERDMAFGQNVPIPHGMGGYQNVPMPMFQSYSGPSRQHMGGQHFHPGGFQAYPPQYGQGSYQDVFQSHYHRPNSSQYSQPEAFSGSHPGRFSGPPAHRPQGNFPDGRQPGPNAAVPSVVAEPKRKVLTITDPKTNQPVEVGPKPQAKPLAASPQAVPRKQPSQGAPTPRSGHPVNGLAPPQSRALSISAPQHGGPSKAFKSKPPPTSAPSSSQAQDPSKKVPTETSRSSAAASEEPAVSGEPAEKLTVASTSTEEASAAAKAAEKAAADKAAEADKAAAAAKAAEEAAAAKAAEEALKREAEAAAKKAQDEASAAAEAKRRADEEAEAAKKAEAEAKRQAEEAASKKRAEEEAAEARAAEDARVEAEAREKAAALEAEQNLAAKKAEEERKAIQLAEEEEAAKPKPPPKKGKKALKEAIAARNESEAYDGREADMSAYRPAAKAAAEARLDPTPVATPEPRPEPDLSKASGSQDSAEDEEDWEDKKIEAPQQESAKAEAPKVGDKRKKFSRDYILLIQKKVAAEVPSWPGLQQLDSAFQRLLRGSEGDMRGGQGRGGPHLHAHMAPRSRETDSWARSKPLPMPAGPGFQGHGVGGPPPPPGRGPGGRGGKRDNSNMGAINSDRWSRGTALPPPPLHVEEPALHKATNRYQRGVLISENPDEEKKQKEIKSLLNKITPEKYEVIKQKIIAVDFSTPLALRGLIDQVFDKALTEPTFCEIYAQLCYDVNKLLPELEAEPGDDRKINFRRSLLNKCQEEFEEGKAAFDAVKEREQAGEQAGSSSEKSDDGKAEAKPAEEDKKDAREVQDKKDAEADRRAEKLRQFKEAEKEMKARRRALGNIQFIGHLYKKQMLTEKIMHQCLQNLLQDVNNPKREDIECLCKLMTTIGAQLDDSPKGRHHMQVYFERMQTFTTLNHLEVRLRFMVQDVIDLRQNRWRERRKVEGPKTIEEIHREAAAEMAPKDRHSHGHPRRGGFGEENFWEPPPQPMAMRARHEDRLEEKPRAMNRTPSQEGIFAPGGRASGSFRPGGSLHSRGPSPASREFAPPAPANMAPPARPQIARASPPLLAQPAGPSRAVRLSEEEIRAKATGLALEFSQLRNVEEVQTIVFQELQPAGADFVLVVEAMFAAAFEKKEITRPAFKELVHVMVSGGMLPQEALQKGLAAVLNQLHDTAVDVPFAPQLVGEVIGDLLALGKLEITTMASSVLDAGKDSAEFQEGEEPPLIDSGFASQVLASALTSWRSAASAAPAVWRDAGLRMSSFFPSFEQDEKSLTAFAEKHELQSFAL